MTAYRGPEFQLVEEISWESFQREKRQPSHAPLLIRGAVRAWPAWERWSFERLAERCQAEGKEAQFQEGLVEQGETQPLPVLPVAPFLRELGQASQVPLSPEAGLLPETRRKDLRPGDRFHLNWGYLDSFKPTRRYLADWPILDVFPDLRRDFAIRTLWTGLRFTWEYVFIGPGQTLTGLHLDIHNNWFFQVRGTKELILLPPDQSPHMCISGKYNLGSVLSRIDISRLKSQPQEAGEFEKTRGYYVRAQAGDALFIPKRTWHAVLSLEPSISMGVFGLNVLEILTEGAWAEVKNVLHRLRLYRWKNCICHESAG
jgi:lysine-specific demethylase 8